MAWFSLRSCCSCHTADKSMRFAELLLLSQVFSLVGVVPGLFPVIWKIKQYEIENLFIYFAKQLLPG